MNDTKIYRHPLMQFALSDIATDGCIAEHKFLKRKKLFIINKIAKLHGIRKRGTKRRNIYEKI